MKKMIFLLLALVASTIAKSQISDEEAKKVYSTSEASFDEGKFYQSYLYSTYLIIKMGRPTPKVLYLNLKSVYNSLEHKNKNDEYYLKKTYTNFNRFSSYCDDFFSLIDKKSYPAEKYNEILELDKYFKLGKKEYDFERNMKPDDAIKFLNECSHRFKCASYSGTYKGIGECDVTYFLDSNVLRIEVFGIRNSYLGNKYNKVGREKILIDLSKVWIQNFNYNFHAPKFHYETFFASEFGDQDALNMEKDRLDRENFQGGFSISFFDNDPDAPLITSSKVFVNNQEKIDNIFYYSRWHYNKSLNYEVSKFDKELKYEGYKKSNVGFYLFTLFDQSSTEYKQENYRSRIIDAFEFLIDYFGGGKPIFADSNSDIKTGF